MNGSSILFETSRFNLSKVGEDFINPCCFGEDVAAWLGSKLAANTVEIKAAYQEDWSWELPARYGDASYYLCIGGNSHESASNKDEGEWRIIVEKRRSIAQRVSGRGNITENDGMIKLIEDILMGEPDIRNVHREL
jgi:hypothetical protein